MIYNLTFVTHNTHTLWTMRTSFLPQVGDLITDERTINIGAHVEKIIVYYKVDYRRYMKRHLCNTSEMNVTVHVTDEEE